MIMKFGSALFAFCLMSSAYAQDAVTNDATAVTEENTDTEKVAKKPSRGEAKDACLARNPNFEKDKKGLLKCIKEEQRKPTA